MDILCPHCESALSIEAEHFGMEVSCPSCDGGFLTPDSDPAEVELSGSGVAPPPQIAGAPAMARTAAVSTGLGVVAAPTVEVGGEILAEEGINRLIYLIVVSTVGMAVAFAGSIVAALLEKLFGAAGGVAALILTLVTILAAIIYAAVSRARNIGWAGWVGAVLLIVPFGTVALLAMPPRYKSERKLDFWFWALVILGIIGFVLSVLSVLATLGGAMG